MDESTRIYKAFTRTNGYDEYIEAYMIRSYEAEEVEDDFDYDDE